MTAMTPAVRVCLRKRASKWRRSPDCAGESLSIRCGHFAAAWSWHHAFLSAWPSWAVESAALIGLGGAAWFLILHGNVEWLGTLLWPVFLFWQLFPLMATAFTQNVESSNLLRFPLSYRSYFLIRLAYGSLDPATAVASLWLLGIDIGIGIARPRALPWATIVLLTFALVNIVLARMLFAWLERWLAQRRTREIMGDSLLSLYSEFSADRTVDCCVRTSLHTPGQGPGEKLSNAQRPLPPGLAAAAIAGTIKNQPATSVVPFVLLVCYGTAFLWLLNFRLRAEYRGESFSESARTQSCAPWASRTAPGWNLPGVPGPVVAVFEKELRYLSRSGPMLFTLIVPLFMLAVFRSSGKNEGLLARMPRNSPSRWALPTHCCC